MDGADVGRGAGRVGRALLVREDRDQPPVARVEVEVALRLVVEVRLVEDERHAEHALPEVDRRLPVGADERDVVDALALELPHRSTSFDLYSLRAKLPHGTSSTRVWMTSTLRSLSRIASASAVSGVASARQLDADRQRRLLLHARRPRPDEDMAAHLGRESAHDVADRRGEDVHAADDQHVVGPPEAADPRAGAAAGARARPDLDVVAGAEAQQRCGSMLQMGQDELPLRAVLQLQRGARLRVDQLGVDEAARAQVHAVLLLALAPERDADVADAHRLGDLGAPPVLELRAERRALPHPARPRRGRARRSSPGGRSSRRGAPRRTGSGRLPRVGVARWRAPAARCSRCRPGYGSARGARRRRARHRRRRARRCRSRRCAGRLRSRRRRSCARTRSPSCRDRRP